ncbi:hypothetical protein [Streptomyces hainanensis]|uniref:Uncharacterized protein n=1 Tax=Streptomyces hainanensis TaxID=402648 RepID=A0A4V2Y405_9ACTN|nr:hypothetical protein [Streptomyces hainanensis]TDC78485.1 hypothetical protein E1283_04990 [Streptomyces hainanensis]
MRHVHAYSWSGRRADFDREAERRPDHPAFAVAEVPPMRVVDWLRKPPRLVRGTFVEPRAAVDWLTERVREQAVESRPPLGVRRAYALSTLGWGGDVSWGYYTGGTGFLSLALVSCPNRAEPELACPAAVNHHTGG